MAEGQADNPLEEALPDTGKLAANIVHFARVLRRAGLPIGPGHVLDAMQAVETIGLSNRRDFYWAMHAVFVSRHEHHALFDQAFHVFWRNPKLLEKMMGLLLPNLRQELKKEGPELSRRLAEALKEGAPPPPERRPDNDEPPEIEIDARLTMSEREVLQTRDFEQMSEAEIQQARQIMRRLTLPLREIATRRQQASTRQKLIDMRRTLRAQARGGGNVVTLKHRQPVTRPPRLVVIADISGSMGQYTRMLLHFLHTLTNEDARYRNRVHSFLFGTRLTPITRQLRARDPDAALAAVSATVADWSGGTRIAHCLDDFNRHWARRVLGQGAVVLLVTDGLERDDPERLPEALAQLHRSCRRLIWLNPLLRYDGFEAKSRSIRLMLEHIDDFRPVHNLASLEDLAGALAEDRQHHWLKTARAQLREQAA